MYRLFVGIDPPASVKRSLEQIAFGVPGARWMTPAQMHLTLRFIGNVDGGVFEDVAESLGEVTFEPFSVTLKGVGFFPPRKDPQVLWAGIEKTPPLVHLRNKIESVLVRMGLDPEGRKFSPHIAIARLKETRLNKVADYLAGNSLFGLPPFTVDRFHLILSILGSEGASYQLESDYLARAAKVKQA